MKDGQTYLLTWCQDNEEAGKPSVPMQLGWVADANAKLTDAQLEVPLADEWRKYAPKEAASIQVEAAQPSKRRRLGSKTPASGMPASSGTIDLPSGDEVEPAGPGVPSAKAASQARAKSTAATRVRAKRAPAAKAPPIRPRARPPPAERVEGALGCPKCRYLPRGCAKCRGPAGP